MGEIEYILLHDAPVHLVDIFARRLEFQWLVHPKKQPPAVKKVANFVGKLMKWDETRQEEEKKQYLEYLAENSFFYEGKLE